MTPATYDLLVCDLDGTLLDDAMALDPALVEAFHRAAEAPEGFDLTEQDRDFLRSLSIRPDPR